MRLYIHMVASGSICTLLYIFFNYAFPWEMPLKWRKAFLKANIMLYLLPVPWLVAQAKGEVKRLLEKAGAVFPKKTPTNMIDATSVWKSILVIDTEGKFLYITGYRNWLVVIVAGSLITVALAAGWLAMYLLVCRRYKRMAEFPEERYIMAETKKVPVGTCACVTSPLTIGIMRPVLLFPDGGMDGMLDSGLQDTLFGGGEEIPLACILRHEISHVLGRDILGKFLTFMVIATEWFNPLAYFLFKENGEVSEMLCDMAAVEGRTKKEKAVYIECIIEAAKRPEGSKAAASIATSKTLTEKRMERLMGRNIKRTWRKGTTVVIMVVCFLVSSIPALAYEDIRKFTVGEESYGMNERWGSTDWLLFNEGDDEAVYSEFMQGNIIFIDEDGIVYDMERFGENSSIQERVSCQHTYKSGTLQQHSKKADGGCTVTTYNAQICTKCENVITGSRISTTTYDKCPH